MMHILKIVLRGAAVDDASVDFIKGGNILAGESDTGKSFLCHCLDYIFGSDAMKKRVVESEPYSQLFVEFGNSQGETITLERSLSGGDLALHECAISEVEGFGTLVAAKRPSPKSKTLDVTAVLFAFAEIPEALLRKNVRGSTQRLTLRTMIPLFLVDEVSVIDEQSPVLGRKGFDDTARKRLLAYMLSGKDDKGIVAAEKNEIVKARLIAQRTLVDDLLAPIEKRVVGREPATDSIEKVEEAISEVSKNLSDATDERATLYAERQQATTALQRSESQVMAIDELIARYDLLDKRYLSDLQRLDFIAEGAHYFDGLQEVTCPLCDQVMTEPHHHSPGSAGPLVYESAKAEAGKIRGHHSDLKGALDTLKSIRLQREAEITEATATIATVERRMSDEIAPALQNGTSKLTVLIERRVELESIRSDSDQLAALRQLKEKFEGGATDQPTKTDWEQLPATALRNLCVEIETLLKEWQWKGDCRVEFDQRSYDIVVDGQARQSHGKGVRAVLYAAFCVGLLRYCKKYGRPHPGTVIIDSPLTSYKKGKGNSVVDGPVETGIEQAFWESLSTVPEGVQIIVIENKEPPQSVATRVHYEWFAGESAQDGERVGFIPRPQVVQQS